MQDLIKAVNEAMLKMSADGTIEEMINKHLKDTVNDILRDQLRSYSDFGKMIKEKLKTDLAVSLENVTFAEHNKTLLNLITGIVNNCMTEDAQAKFKTEVNELLGTAPKEIKLSELIIQYIEENNNEFGRDDADRIGLVIEKKEYSCIGVALHPKNTQDGYLNKGELINSWQQCDLYMSVKVDKDRGKLRWTHDRDGLKPHQFMPTCLRGVSRLLYKMYCAGTVLIFDEGFDPENYDIYYDEE